MDSQQWSGFPCHLGTAKPSVWRSVGSHSPCWATAEALVREIGHRDSAQGARVVWSGSSGHGRDGVKNVHWAGRDFGQPACLAPPLYRGARLTEALSLVTGVEAWLFLHPLALLEVFVGPL